MSFNYKNQVSKPKKKFSNKVNEYLNLIKKY